MIMLTIGLLASAVLGWWRHRKSAKA